MAKDLRLDVVSSSDGTGLVSAAAEVDHLADKTDKLGHKFDETAVEGAFLARELDAVKRKSLELAAAFNETGDKALLKQIAANQRYEAQLNRVGKELDKVGKSAEKEGAKLGKELAKGTESGFEKWLSGANSGGGIMGFLVTPQGIAAATVAGTVLGVMAGGAILTGIGLAGIGVGVAAELKDPRVTAALQGLKSDIGSTLTDAAKPMIAPLLGAFADLDSQIKSDIGPGLKGMFADLAPEIGVVTHGLGVFLSKVITGFEHAAVASKPLLNVLGSELLPQLGQDILALFDTIARHSKEAEQGLKALFFTIEAGIGLVNIGINVFSALWDMMVGQFEAGVIVADKFVGAMIDVDKAMHLPHQDLDEAKKSLDGFVLSTDNFRTGADGLHGGFDVASAAAAGYSSATADATQKTKDLTDAWKTLDGALSEDQAISHGLDLIAGLAGQLDKHTKSLDQNSAKSRSNREAVVGDIQQERDALSGLVSSGQITQAQADKMYAAWFKDFEKTAVKSGVSKQSVEDLNKQLGLLPKSKTINIHINETIKAAFSAAAAALAGIVKPHATGGTFMAGQTLLVGERRPELVQFDRGGTIAPRVPSAMPGSAGGGGGGAMVLGYESSGDALVDAIVGALRPYIRNRFSGDVTAALGGAR